MLLAMDVGNTNTVFGFGSSESDDFQFVFRLATRRDNTSQDWAASLLPLMDQSGIATDAVTGVVLSSVVPAVTTALAELSAQLFAVDPLVVSATIDLGISVEVDNSTEVGSDRLTNCSAAFELYGGPTVVVDMGTATKIESISPNGTFRGGVIAPGMGVTLDALASRAARLYSVELKKPDSVIGKNTVAAVQSGVVTGHIAMIEGIVARMAVETEPPVHVVLTGGYSASIAASSPVFTDIRPDLTLVGLRRIYARNRGGE